MWLLVFVGFVESELGAGQGRRGWEMSSGDMVSLLYMVE